jgi:hypothetical protein
MVHLHLAFNGIDVWKENVSDTSAGEKSNWFVYRHLVVNCFPEEFSCSFYRFIWSLLSLKSPVNHHHHHDVQDLSVMINIWARSAMLSCYGHCIAYRSLILICPSASPHACLFILSRSFSSKRIFSSQETNRPTSKLFLVTAQMRLCTDHNERW